MISGSLPKYHLQQVNIPDEEMHACPFSLKYSAARHLLKVWPQSKSQSKRQTSELFFPLYKTRVISIIVIDNAASIRHRIPSSSGRTTRALGEHPQQSFPSFKMKSPRSRRTVSSPAFLTHEETRCNEKKVMPQHQQHEDVANSLEQHGKM